MKKQLTAIIISLITALFVFHNTACADSQYNWYFKRETDHKTPALPSEFSFIKKYNVISTDENHTRYEDPEKVIYLTFDAGYENGNVEKILNVLKEEKVTAAFFILGNLIDRNTDLVKRMAEEGHLVCNHTCSHKNMSKATADVLLKEVSRLEEKYRSVTGYEMAKLYRPPEGCFSEKNLEVLSKAGYRTVFWSFAYADWDNEKQPDKETALKKLKENLHNGEIMLLHPTSKTNAEILSEFIKYAKSEGFEFGSLNDIK